MDPVRLACVKHAASVRPEPGSNSPTKACRALGGCLDLERLVRRALGPVECSGDPNDLTDCVNRSYGRTRRSSSIVLSPGGTRRHELTDSCASETAGADSPDELPALAFCLLFRFQGAEALARPAV